MTHRFLYVFPLLLVSACNKSPNAPDPAVTGLTLTLQDVVLAGTSATATASATLDNGQTQAVTTGFRSESTAIATATDAGSVTGVANGEATISVTFKGANANKRIRVAPSYGGRWQGNQRVTSCVATLDFVGVCEFEGGLVNQSFPIGLIARHPAGLTVSGELIVENTQFPTFTTVVANDGSIEFAAMGPVEFFTVESAWRLNSTAVGNASGTIREVFTAPEFAAGEIVVEFTVTQFVRTSTTTTTGLGPALAARLRAWRHRIGR